MSSSSQTGPMPVPLRTSARHLLTCTAPIAPSRYRQIEHRRSTEFGSHSYHLPNMIDPVNPRPPPRERIRARTSIQTGPRQSTNHSTSTTIYPRRISRARIRTFLFQRGYHHARGHSPRNDVSYQEGLSHQEGLPQPPNSTVGFAS
jgi:hypothetical protein